MRSFAGYVRVSRVGDRAKTLISPRLQEQEIRRWANSRAAVELEMLPDELDQSGGKDERPILQAAIERISAGELHGIVVWNFARFTRSLPSSIRFLEAIEGAGGELHSASQPVDPHTPSGRMTRNFFFSIAQAEREEAAAGFDKAKADAIGRGVWTAPHVPFGFVKNDERHLEPHPTEARVLAEVIRRRGRGDTWRALRDYIRLETGRDFTINSVRGMVRSRVALGEVRQGEHVNHEAHKPIVDRATWEAAQLLQPKPPRGDGGEALLAGLVRCAGCSRLASPRIRNGLRYYNCRKFHSAGDCPAPANANAELERLVVAALFAHADDVAYSATERSAAVEEAGSRLEAAEAELVLYQETVRLSDIGAEHFDAGMRSRTAEVEAARRELAAARLAAPRVLPGTLAQIWPSLSVPERRQVLRSSFSVVWLRRDGATLRERVRVIGAGFEPAGLSGSGRSAGPLVTLGWPVGDLEGEVRVPSVQDRGEASGGAGT